MNCIVKFVPDSEFFYEEDQNISSIFLHLASKNFVPSELPEFVFFLSTTFVDLASALRVLHLSARQC